MNELIEKILKINEVPKEQILDDNDKKLFWERIEKIPEDEETKKWYKLFDEAIHSNKKISIFSDYDCDGVCSGSLLYRALVILGVDRKNINLIFPSREIGYGFSKDYMDEIKRSKYLMTCDNGIGLGPLFDELVKEGITVIGSDHHLQEIERSKSDRVAMVDVNSTDSQVKFKEICGTTVIWKLLLGYCQLKRLKKEFKMIFSMIDLVGLSTVSDVMPLINENRFYVQSTLKIMNSVKTPKRWLYLRNMNQKDFSYNDLGWKIAPMINADSRVNDRPEKAFTLMTSSDSKMMERLSNMLTEDNEHRKDVVKNIVDNVIEDQKEKDTKYIYVLEQDEKENLVPYAGIIASRLVGYYKRPFIVVVKTKDGMKGSARSFGSFDLINDSKSDVLKESSLEIHGHAGAAGVFFEEKDLDRITDEFTRIINETDKERFNEEKITSIDIEPDIITLKNFKELDKLEPFGKGFELPPFVLKDVDISKHTMMGKKKNHFRMTQQLKDCQLSIIIWNYYDFKDKHHINESKHYDLVGSLQINEFRGVYSLQLIVDDAILSTM